MILHRLQFVKSRLIGCIKESVYYTVLALMLVAHIRMGYFYILLYSKLFGAFSDSQTFLPVVYQVGQNSVRNTHTVRILALNHFLLQWNLTWMLENKDVCIIHTLYYSTSCNGVNSLSIPMRGQIKGFDRSVNQLQLGG